MVISTDSECWQRLLSALVCVLLQSFAFEVCAQRTEVNYEKVSRSLNGSANISYRVNKTDIDPTYINNPRELRKILGSIDSVMNDTTSAVLRVWLKGYASPEGSLASNTRLSQGRTESLRQLLKERYHFPDSIFLTAFCAEDWDGLQAYADTAALPHADDVRALLRQGGDADAREKRLAQRFPEDYRLLLENCYPLLRRTEFRIDYTCYDWVRHERTFLDPVEIAGRAFLTPGTVLRGFPARVPVFTIDSVIPRREWLSVKTNLLMYGVYMPGYNRWCPMPNIAVEYYPKRGHFTYGFSFDMPWWQNYKAHKYFQLRNYQVETRYYFKGSKPYQPAHRTHESQGAYEPYKAPAFKGFYLSAYAHGGLFGICFDADRGWVGEGVGAGLGAGYVVPVSRNGHWRLEFQLQGGFFTCKYDPYKYENPVNPAYHDDLYYYKWTLKPELFRKRQYRFNWLGPTRVGITLSYDLLYRRHHKRGISFKAHEPATLQNPAAQ